MPFAPSHYSGLNDPEYFQSTRPGLEDMMRTEYGYNAFVAGPYKLAKLLTQVAADTGKSFPLKPGWDGAIADKIAKREEELTTGGLSLLNEDNLWHGLYDDEITKLIASKIKPLMQPYEGRTKWLPEEGGVYKDWVIQLRAYPKKNWPSTEDLLSKAAAVQLLEDARHGFLLSMKNVKNLENLFFDCVNLFLNPVGFVSGKVKKKLKEEGVGGKKVDEAVDKAASKVPISAPEPQDTFVSAGDVKKIADYALKKVEGSVLDKLNGMTKTAQTAYTESLTKYRSDMLALRKKTEDKRRLEEQKRRDRIKKQKEEEQKQATWWAYGTGAVLGLALVVWVVRRSPRGKV
jgi:hypothetical protein